MKIRYVLFFSGILPWLFSAQAAAIEQKASGPSASNFIQALRLSAGIYPQKFSSGFTYNVDYLYCHSSLNITEDGFPSYYCTINSKQKIIDASAKLLYDALLGLKILDEPGMSQNRLTAEHVHCFVQPIKREKFYCRWQDPRIN